MHVPLVHSRASIFSMHTGYLQGHVKCPPLPCPNCMCCVLIVMIFSLHSQELLEMIQGWAREAGEDCTVEFRIRASKSPVVSTDESDPWWRAFSSACKHRYGTYRWETLQALKIQYYIGDGKIMTMLHSSSQSKVSVA